MATEVKRIEPLYLADDAGFPLECFDIPPQYKPYVSKVLLSHGLILDRVAKLARDISAAYAGRTPHLLVVLKGGYEFATDLMRFMKNEHSYDTKPHLPFTVDFVRVKSYEGTESTGKVSISGINMKTLEGRDLILVEDIIDTGVTMSNLIPALMEYKPASVKVASLLEKRTHRSCGFKADFVGFSIPDFFIVGYNMDYNEAYRDMSHLCIINPEGIEYFKSHPILAGLN